MRYTTARFGEQTNLLGQFTALRPGARTFTVNGAPPSTTALVTSHPYTTGDGPHRLRSTGTLPGGLNSATDYWIGNVTGSTISFHTSQNDALALVNAVSMTTAGTGTHTISSAVQMTLIDIDTDTSIPLVDGDCDELTVTTRSGLSTYKWKTTKIVDPADLQTEYEYLMEDRYTGAIHPGKVVFGGHPDDSAKGRYFTEVHLDQFNGFSLPVLATMTGGPNLTFSGTTITRNIGDWQAEGFAIGQRIQISDTAFNDGVTEPITAISPTIITIGLASFTAEGPVGGVTVEARAFQFPLGTQEEPLDNIRDARQVAMELGFNTYHIRNGSAFDVDFPHDNWVFIGDDPDTDTVNFLTGASNAGARFTTMGIFGALNGRIITERCIVGVNAGTVTGLQGVLNRTGVAGTLNLAAGGTLTGLEVAARDLLGTTVSFAAGNCGLLCGAVLGIWTITNMTGGDICGMALNGSIVTFHSSCTGGIARVGGVGELSSSGSGGFALIDEVVRGTRIDTNIASRAAASALTTVNTIVTEIRKFIKNRRKIDTTTTPWQEVVYDDNEVTELQRANLKDTAGANITNSNRPAGVIVGERDPV